ncbi:MAG: ATP-binding protein [Oscillospiraceae bacterium]|nr:ATP-binding protein [Oscillospiraceae bacterium]
MLEPNWLAQAEHERQARVSRRAAVYRERLEERYAAHPRLKEIEDALRAERVSAIADGLLSGGDRGGSGGPADTLAAGRADYLRETGLEPLAQDAYCPLCGDTGRQGHEPCGCVKAFYVPLQRAALSREIDLEAQSFPRFDLGRFQDERPASGDYTPRDLMTEARDTARDYCDTFGAHRRSLLISGGVGTGKTFLSACMLGAVTERAFWAEYVTAIRYLQWAEAEQFGRVYPDGRGFRRFARCDLLVLDDLGTEYLSPFAQTAYYDLINTRLQQRRCTVITTNLTGEGLQERYLPQTASRLRGEYELLYLMGPDLRGA